MAPRTKSKDHRRKKGPVQRNGRVRKTPRRTSSVASSSKKNLIPESNDPLEENITESVPMPDGYVFVPKGDVYTTRNCRSKTKESSRAVFVIYNKSGKRIQGIRVPAEIYANVVEMAALTSGSRANAVQARDTKLLSHGRKLLREQFPLIPEESLEIIVNHSFLKGSGRVGRATTTTDKRKATLAVEAHIRHKHTPYEKLLSSGIDRKDAREEVWPTVQAIKKTWEGNGENKENDVECLTIRSAEVVVLD